MFLFLLVRTVQISAFSHPNPYCLPVFQGDEICDLGCLTKEGNFDSAILGSSAMVLISSSDCFMDCIDTGCPLDKLLNEECDEECNNEECGWDGNNCGYCSKNCTLKLLNNNKPDEVCNTKYCLYDNNQFGWCAPGCFYEDLYSNIPKSACNVSDCDYQNGIALYNYSPNKCNKLLLENDVCDDLCNTEEYNYDNGNCLCAPGCTDSLLSSDSCDWTSPCMVEECNYMDGKCSVCTQNCLNSNIGDGICQSECNSIECDYDGGDCGCAPGCDSKYIEGAWNMVGGCNLACLVESCMFNYLVCKDTSLLTVSIMWALIYQDYNEEMAFDANNSCTLENLTSLVTENGNYDMKSYCMNKDCLYCIGNSSTKPIDCIKTIYTSICVVSNSSKFMNYRGYENIQESTYINEYSTTIEDLNKVIGQQIYFVKEGSYSKKSPLILTVSNELSLYNAMVLAMAPYVTIKIGEGSFNLSSVDSCDEDGNFLKYSNSPLYKRLDFTQYTLVIEGSGIDLTNVYFLEEIRFVNYFQKTYIRDLNFSGHLLIENDCKVDYCYYCPYFTETSSGKYFTDRYELVEEGNMAYYNSNCDNFETVLFEFHYETYIENVKFYNFRQQAPGLIETNSQLTITDTIFEKIQPGSDYFVIKIECEYYYDPNECAPVTLTLSNVQVVDLNYGYEHIDDINQGGFLYAVSIGDILFENVQFSYDMVISCASCSSLSLLEFENVLGSIQILDCTFEYLYIDNLMRIDSSDINYGDTLPYEYDKYGKLLVYSMNHLFINNTVFQNIYSEEGIIASWMVNVKQNIEISYCSFKNIATMKYGLLRVDGTDNPTSVESEGIWEYEVINGSRKKVYYSSRFITLSHLYINNFSAGPYLFFFNMYPNIVFLNITTNNIKENTENDPYDYSIVYFKNSKKYLSQAPDSSLITITSFISVYYSTYINHLKLQNVSASAISSTDSDFCFFYLDTANINITFKNVSISEMNLHTHIPVGVYLNSVGEVFIDGFYLSRLTNTYDSILSITKTTNISINDATLQNINTNYSAAFLIDGGEKIALGDFVVDSISSYDSKGSLFNIILGSSATTLELSNITITNSENKNGRGLLIYLDSQSSMNSFNLTFADISLKECTVEDSFLYFDFNLYFEQSSISNLSIENSVCNKGGIITDIHNKGILKFDNFTSSSNTAIYCAIVSKYTSVGDLLIVSNSVIKHCNCSSDVFFVSGIIGSVVDFNNLTIYNVTAGNSGILVTYADLNGDNVYLNDSTLLYGLIITNANLKFEELKCRNLSSQCVFSIGSTFSCNTCKFYELSNTVLNMFQSSSFDIENSYFSDVSSSDNDFLYITNAKSVNSYFKECTFANSYSSKGQFEIDKSTLNFINCTVKDNTSGSSYCITLSNSNLAVSGSKFYNQSYTYIYATVTSQVELSSSEFYGNLTSIDGFDSNQINTRSLLSALELDTSAGAVYIKDSTLTINDCIFNELYSTFGAAIYSDSTTTYINSSSFSNCGTSESSGGVVYLKSNTATLISSHFSESLTKTSLVYSDAVTYLTITSCLFSDNNSSEGSGVYLSDSSCTVDSTIFQNNYAEVSGGGICSSDSDLIVQNCEFISNEAGSKGGGIEFDFSPMDRNTLTFKENNYFTFNKVVNGSGGAINWEGNPPTVEGINYFSNNSALYGPDNAAYPVQLTFKSRRYLTDISNFRPGATFTDSLEICYLDTYGNIITSTDFDSQIALLSASPPTVVTGQFEFNSISGCFNITGFTIVGKPGTDINLTLSSQFIKTDLRNINDASIESEIEISVNLRECSYGEAIGDVKCDYCAPTKYLIQPSGVCLSCPTGAECLGAFLMLPKQGYWKVDKYADIIYQCSVSEACLGSKNISDDIDYENVDFYTTDIDYSGTCAKGYHGHLCATCLVGYSKASDGKCSKCPDQTSNILIMLSFAILMVIVVYIMINSTLRSAFSAKSLHSIYIKIFTNYLQIIFLTTELSLNWPNYVQQLFTIQRSAASASDQVYSIDCLFDKHSGYSDEDIYYNKVILAVSLPIIIFILSFVFWLLYGFYKETYSYLKQEFFTTIIVLFFLVQPNIIKTVFGSFSCREIKSVGYWLTDNLEIKCWTSSHLKVLFSVALPGILLWCFGVPLIVLIMMIKRYRYLSKDTNKVIFGFIYNGYKQRKFYWEFIILYRKIIIICASVFLANVSTHIQALTVVIIIVVALYLQYSQHPYVHKQLNYMESEALLTACVTLYCGLYYLTSNLNTYVSTFLFALIVIGNIYFIIYWIYYMMKAISDILVRVFPVLRRVFKKGDYFDRELYEKNLQSEGVYFDKSDGEKKYTLFRAKSSSLQVKLERVQNMNELYALCMKENSGKLSRNSSERPIEDFK